MKNMKNYWIILIINLLFFNSYAQVGIGTPLPAGALDITSINDGLLIPRVALTSTSTVLPVITGTTSELVYNTATAGDVTPGFYYLSTASGPWLRIGTASFTEVDPKVLSSTNNRIPKWNGTALVDGIVNDDGTRVGIGTGVTTPLGALEVTSTNEGILIPRFNLTLGSNFSAPVAVPNDGELIYNTATTVSVPFGPVTPGFYYWKTLPAPAKWERFVTGAVATTGWQTTGNAALAADFLGTTNAIDLAFRRNNLAAGKIGATSTSFGVGALNSGAATNSTAIGNNALANSAGFNNVALGQNALQALPGLAQYNTAVGVNALPFINVAAAQNNTAVGFNAMGTTAGDISNCTAVGVRALLNVDGTTAARGLNNTGIGYEAGSNISRGENNTAIGYMAQVALANNSNQVRIGNAFISLATTQIAWTTTSDRRWKDNIKDSGLGLDFIKSLRPVSYVRNNDEAKKTEYGFIAQELETALINAGDPNNAIISKDDAGMYGVRYNDFISISVKAIQEQQVQIEELKKENKALQNMNAAILKRLEALEKK